MKKLGDLNVREVTDVGIMINRSIASLLNAAGFDAREIVVLVADEEQVTMFSTAEPDVASGILASAAMSVEHAMRAKEVGAKKVQDMMGGRDD